MEILPELSPEALSHYYAATAAEIEGEIRYYRRKRKTGRAMTMTLRVLALAAVAAGVLLPLLGTLADQIADAIGRRLGLATVHPLTGAEAAYVALAIGALLLLVDQVFTVTSGWARYMLAELKLKAVLCELQFAWAARYPAVSRAGASDRAAKAALADFCKAQRDAKAIVEAETNTWASELDRAKAALSEKVGRRP